MAIDRPALVPNTDTDDDEDLLPLPTLNIPQGVTSLGRTLIIKGELTAEENLIIEGTVEGNISVPEHAVAVGRTARVSADIMAKTVTILGEASGRFTASEKIELRQTARVVGGIIATRVEMIEGAIFEGSIDPSKTETAVAVGKHRFKEGRPTISTESPNNPTTDE
ncbi:MAG: polymer-forming cytoskeletal protein [Acidobacteriota bacterium]|nr:polymer-forming cytoskeletal protein [Acidobacteriota bacterium]